MKIYGIDFTSSPSKRKPITCAEGELTTQVLQLNNIHELTDFSQFESQLSQPGPWVAGMDFPFGQSQRLLMNLNWPPRWQDYVGLVANMSRDEFVEVLNNYKANRAPGDKEHRREIDRLASSISPQKLYGVPVGKMFYEGSRRLLVSDANIVPVRRTKSEQTIVEAYPAIIARRFIANQSYKNDQKSKQTIILEQARREILAGLYSSELAEIYGFALSLPVGLKHQLIGDATGDSLDAVLCTIQAAWAWMNRKQGYGIPEQVNSSEGWIVDPKFNEAM